MALNANVVVDFSERIVGANQTTVVLTNVATGATLDKAVNLNAAGTRLTVNPNANFALEHAVPGDARRGNRRHQGRLRQPAGHDQRDLPEPAPR